MIDLSKEGTRLTARYPEGRSRSALIPLLHAAQKRDGWVTPASVEEIAGILDLTPAEVQAVASFYTMLHKQPKGRHVVSVCHNIACTLAGAESLISRIERHLGIRCGQTMPSGEITLERAECLAHCELAPMIQIDYDEMIGPLDGDSALGVLGGLLRPAAPEPVSASPASSQPATLSEPHGTASPEIPEPARAPRTEPEPITTSEPALVDTIEISPAERDLLRRSTERRGVKRPPSAPERLVQTPPLAEGVGPGPAPPQELGVEDGAGDENPRRPRGAD